MSYVGIDISKAWFDAYCLRRRQVKRFANDEQGWGQLWQWTGPDAHIVMEASGPYYLRGACWSQARGFSVSVLNRRYCQMRLTRVKTDTKDAQLIAEYAQAHRPALWSPPSKENQAMRQLVSLHEGLLRQQTQLRGQREAFSYAPEEEAVVGQVIAEQLKAIRQGLRHIEHRLEMLANQQYQRSYRQLQTIPGIGAKTALLLICVTDGFSKFDDSRKLASYVGICPRIYQSGSSINGRGSICKLGCSQLRKLLYMCSWTAKTCNPGCAELYERMKSKGKPERVIKVAIAHKLLRQAFAVGKSGEGFDKEKAMAA
ncbi:IS110 family transposase [Gracilimonas mengyeensis]|uniref:Transposase n=2 Tax=Gracilimonas mengyeensis TaxID=1302730 RepID=A0A521FPP8_9BACT|nr:IS110 family transposase [Gracilimonas mengyeensis]SMO98183.1 Transposase [Gracilimonas mengyeensis]